MATPPYVFKMLRWGQWIGILGAAATALVVVLLHQYHRREIVARIREHNRVEMDRSRGHIEDYVGTPHMDPRFIGRDDEAAYLHAPGGQLVETLAKWGGIGLLWLFGVAIFFDCRNLAKRLVAEDIREKEQARLSLMGKIIEAQEEQRKNISRELHDQLGQSLLALLLKNQAICEELQAPESVCQDIEDQIRRMIEEVRLLAWEMRPSILDDYGLDSALKRHVSEVSDQAGLSIDYQCSGSPGQGRLPDRIEVALYRIAQEALTNVVHHAQATWASVVVLQRSDCATLLVEDNGRGFDSQAVHRAGTGGLGLTGMKERAALLGGNCDIESTPGEGTMIRASIPLEASRECLSAS